MNTSAGKVAVWTSRDVQFSVHPRGGEESFERLFGVLPEHYWDTWRHRVLGTLAISSVGFTVTVGGWPWWVPKALALHSVAAIAASHGVGGDARFLVERVVLPPSSTHTTSNPRRTDAAETQGGSDA